MDTWPSKVLKICVLALALIWHMFWNPEFQYFVTFDDSRKARWQTKKFVFSLFLKANSSKIQNFFNPEEICSIKLPEYQWKYSITHQKLVKKHQFKANLMILSLFWGILREKNVFVICEIFSHPMFSWHTFPDQGRSKYHPLCNGSHGLCQKNFGSRGTLCTITPHIGEKMALYSALK